MRSMMKHIRHATWAMAVGAGLAYFLDPDQGGERRRRVLDLVDGLIAGSGGDTDTASGTGRQTSFNGDGLTDDGSGHDAVTSTPPTVGLGSR